MTQAHLLIACLVLIVQASVICALQIWTYDWDGWQRLEEVPIDAFDEKICGAAEFEPWQASQSAFGCVNGPEKAVPGFHNRGKLKLPDQVEEIPSRLANPNEFPFIVHYKVKGTTVAFSAKASKYCSDIDRSPPTSCDGTEQLDHFGKCVDGKIVCSESSSPYVPVPYTAECIGLLVDKNLVITDNECLHGGEIDSIELTFGTNSVGVSSLTSGVPVVRRARKWCWQPRELAPESDVYNVPLAVIELNEPVDYVKGRIWPACLRKTQGQHLNDTVCTLALKCPRKALKSVAVVRNRPKSSSPSTYRKLDSHLKWDRCYGANAMVCYDKCSKEEPDRVQAFAIGVGWIHADATFALSFDEYRRDLFELLLKIRNRDKLKSRVACAIAQVKGNTEDDIQHPGQ